MSLLSDVSISLKEGTKVEEFLVKLPNGHQQKGLAFKDAGTTKNLVILTGMNEHSHRYQELAEYLNGVGYDVYVLDAVGQGLNAPKIEDQEKWYKGAFDDNVMYFLVFDEHFAMSRSSNPSLLLIHLDLHRPAISPLP